MPPLQGDLDTASEEGGDMMDLSDLFQQQEDEAKAFFRCVELVEIAKRSQAFTKTDLQDLIYHLGVSEHFKGEK